MQLLLIIMDKMVDLVVVDQFMITMQTQLVVVLELLVKEIMEELEHTIIVLILAAAAAVLVVLVEMELTEVMVALEESANSHLLMEQQLIMLEVVEDMQVQQILEQVV